MAMEFKKAKRSQAKLKVALMSISGGGKTMSALLMAFGLVRAENPGWSDADCWEHICIIDTENGSGQLYVGATVGGNKIGEYNAIDLDPPFAPSQYVDAIHLAERNDQRVIIVDSMSAAWKDALDKQGQIAARTGNSFTSWREPKKEIKNMMDAILQSPSHVISTFRAKSEYAQEKNDKGKTVVRNLGMGAIFEGEAEYEFSTVFMLDNNHVANATKDRTGLFDGQYFVITPETGMKFAQWLSSGAKVIEEPKPEMHAAPSHSAPAPAPAYDAPPPADIPDMFAVPVMEEIAPPPVQQPAITMEMLNAAIWEYTKDKTTEQKAAIGNKVAEVCGSKNYRTVTDPVMIEKLYRMFVR